MNHLREFAPGGAHLGLELVRIRTRPDGSCAETHSPAELVVQGRSPMAVLAAGESVWPLGAPAAMGGASAPRG